MADRTDFSGYSHPALIQMLHASQPDAVTAAGDTWAAIGRSLHDRAGDLEDQLRVFDGMWQGDAAHAYHTMVRDLIDGIRQTASTALTLRDLSYQASDALQKAWRAMPSTVDVPALSPAVVATATNPLAPPPGASTAAVAALVQQQAQAAALVRQHQDAVTASTAAQAQAAAVMTWLADQDVAIQNAVPQAPSATVAAVGPDGTVAPGSGGVVNPVVAGGSTGTPLFSQVYGAGVAAAGAALGGRFGGVKLPGAGVAAGVTAAVAARAMRVPGPQKVKGARLGSLPKLAAPAAGAASLAGAFSPPSGAPSGSQAGGFMPAMPFGAAAAGDSGGTGRRIPPWLVETEDVWGESATVVPSVLGD